MWSLKKPELIKIENRLVVTRDEGFGVEGMIEGDQKVQTPGYKINNFWGCTVQHGDYS